MIRAPLVAGVFLSSLVWAGSPFEGTWRQRAIAGDPFVNGQITMTIQESGGKKTITWEWPQDNGKMVMTVASKFDGTEAPVKYNGQPSEETMAIKLVDSRHSTTEVKLGGKVAGNTRAEVSADGKTIKSDEDWSGGPQKGKRIIYWDRQK